MILRLTCAAVCGGYVYHRSLLKNMLVKKLGTYIIDA